MTKLTATTVKGQLEEIEFIKKARELSDKIGHIKIAMLTTSDAAGKLESRPMYTFEIEDDGLIWMFASKDSRKRSSSVESEFFRFSCIPISSTRGISAVNSLFTINLPCPFSFII